MFDEGQPSLDELKGRRTIDKTGKKNIGIESLRGLLPSGVATSSCANQFREILLLLPLSNVGLL